MEETKNVFDVLYEKMSLSLVNGNYVDVKHEIRSFEKMLGLFNEWKTSNVIKNNVLDKFLNSLKSEYIIKELELHNSRNVLELNEIASSLTDLIKAIERKQKPSDGYTYMGVSINKEDLKNFMNEGTIKGVTLNGTNISNSTSVDMLKYSWENGILIALTDENKHRSIGKTTELVKFANEKDVTLIVPTHQGKKYADDLARNLSIPVHIQYAGSSLSGTRCKNNKFIVDEGVSQEVILELAKGGNELMGGFTSHYVKQIDLDDRKNDVFIKANYHFSFGRNIKPQLNLRESEYPIKSGNFTELMSVSYNRESMQLDVTTVINIMSDLPEPRSFTVNFKGRSFEEVAEFIIEFILLFNVKHFYMSKNGIEWGIWDYLIPLFEKKSIRYDEEKRFIIRNVKTQ